MKQWEKGEIEIGSNAKVLAQMPVIISASRSTDIPAFYADWFFERFNKGYVRWTNPFSGKDLYVSFAKTRMIVFWSKNPRKILPYLKELDERRVNYYFQFTLNDYDDEGLEPGVPSLAERIDTFKALSDLIGPGRVNWRFDPLILTDKISLPSLVEKVGLLGDKLASYTKRMVFSFADISSYARVSGNLKKAGINAIEWTPEAMLQMAKDISKLNSIWRLKVGTCAEEIDIPDEFGIRHNRCIDDHQMVEEFSSDEVLMKWIGARFIPGDLYERSDRWEPSEHKNKDSGQRLGCGCIMSKDIGEYNTCPHLCHYCYANTSNESALRNWQCHCKNPGADTITGR